LHYRELSALAALEKEAKLAKAMLNSCRFQQGDLVKLTPGLQHCSVGVSCLGQENRTA
jgi:hypothetical protein